MHRNKANGKVYIGMTGQQPKDRWLNGKGYRDNQHFYRAIKKYGWEAGFDHIILYDELTEEEAKKKEIETIAEYNSTDQNIGYNISLGGDTRVTIPIYAYNSHDGMFICKYPSVFAAAKEADLLPEKIKTRLDRKSYYGVFYSKKYRGIRLPKCFLDVVNIDNVRKRKIAKYDLTGRLVGVYDSKASADRSISDKAQIVINNKTSYGFIWKYFDDNPPENLEKEELERIVINAASVPVNQYTLDGKYVKTWHSATEASKELSISCTGINSCLLGKYNHSNGFIWRYESCCNGTNDITIDDGIVFNLYERKRAVIQYDIYGNIVSCYDSLRDASRATGILDENIGAVCGGKAKTAGGFIWRYANDCLNKSELNSILTNKRKRSIIQFDMNDNIVSRYESCSVAAKTVGVTPGAIISCCTGKSRSSAGYKWKYAD